MNISTFTVIIVGQLISSILCIAFFTLLVLALITFLTLFPASFAISSLIRYVHVQLSEYT